MDLIIDNFYKTFMYLVMKPPFSDFERQAEFGGNMSSGLYKISTSTDSSAWIKGRNCSSNKHTMS